MRAAGCFSGIQAVSSGGWVLLGVGIRSADGAEFGGMVIAGKSLYVGGRFDTAGNRLSAGIGRYDLSNDFTRPFIDSVGIRPGGVLRCTAINVFGDTAVPEASGDLSGWLRLATNPVAGQGVTFDDPLSAASSHRLYRVVVP